jgi:hypothetical protein
MVDARLGTTDWSQLGSTVAEALAPAERRGSSWHLSVGTALEPTTISAEIADGWLVLRSEPIACTATPERLAALNAWLPGCTKLAAFGGDLGIRAGAELPVGLVTITTDRIRKAVAGVEVARRLAVAHTDETAPPTDAGGGDADVDLPTLVADTGFEFFVRSPVHVAVDLGLPEAFRQADVRAAADGSVAATVAFDSPAAVPSSPSSPAPGAQSASLEGDCACTRAAALLLLRASAWVRMARGVLTIAPGGAQAHFDIIFASEPSAAELAEGLSALSAAVRLCGQELETLMADSNVARLYIDQNQTTTNATKTRR